MNVMSMIRAAGRAGDVPKALELLRQLELSERCLWPSEHKMKLKMKLKMSPF